MSPAGDIKELRDELRKQWQESADFRSQVVERLTQVAGELKVLGNSIHHLTGVIVRLNEVSVEQARAVESLEKSEIRRETLITERDSRLQAQVQEHETAIGDLHNRQVASSAVAREKKDERNYQRLKNVALLAGAAATGRFGPEILGALFKALSGH